MRCLLHSRDLMFSSQVAAAAGRADVDVQTMATAEQLLDGVAETTDCVVLIDLTLPGLDIGTLTPQLREKSGAGLRVVAVGPHVQEQRLVAARQAGCDHVLTKGQASRELTSLLQSLS